LSIPADEGIDGEGGVADPGVAIVPVAFSADGLGKAEGGRGDDRPELGGGEEFEHEGRSVDGFPPAAAVSGVIDPIFPVIDRGGEVVVDGLFEGLSGDILVYPAFSNNKVRGPAGGQGEFRCPVVIRYLEGDAGFSRTFEPLGPSA